MESPQFQFSIWGVGVWRGAYIGKSFLTITFFLATINMDKLIDYLANFSNACLSLGSVMLLATMPNSSRVVADKGGLAL